MNPRHVPTGIALGFTFLLGGAATMTPSGALASSHATTPTTRTMTEMVNAEVRKVDKDAKKITLRHGEIKQLDMPGMTMVFQVKDPSMLEAVKAGDKVSFKAEIAGGVFVITEIEAAK